MTGSGREETYRQWAAGQLGLAADATAAEARAAFLRRLPREDFVPPLELVQAARCFGVGATAARDARTEAEVARAEEAALRVDVEEFADQYWELRPADRRTRWETLWAHANFSLGLRARLKCLEDGLDIARKQVPAGTDPLVAELACRVCDIYVLRLAARARAWQAVWREARRNIWGWKAAAEVLVARYPDIAALQSEAVKKFAKWEGPSSVQPPRIKSPEEAASTWQQYRWLVWLLAIVVGGVVKSFDSSDPLRPPDRSTRPSAVPVEGMEEAERRLFGVPKDKERVEMPPGLPGLLGPQPLPTTSKLSKLRLNKSAPPATGKSP
jgi:hypothetical protein